MAHSRATAHQNKNTQSPAQAAQWTDQRTSQLVTDGGWWMVDGGCINPNLPHKTQFKPCGDNVILVQPAASMMIVWCVELVNQSLAWN